MGVMYCDCNHYTISILTPVQIRTRYTVPEAPVIISAVISVSSLDINFTQAVCTNTISCDYVTFMV